MWLALYWEGTIVQRLFNAPSVQTVARGLVAVMTWVGVVCICLCQAAVAESAYESADGGGTVTDLVAALEARAPDVEVVSVFESDIPGLYGVELSGANYVYGTADGRHIVAGDLYALRDGWSNRTEAHREATRRTLLTNVEPSDAVVFPAAERRAAITVFTDVDCTVCREFHSRIDEIGAAGVEVRYLAYPRAGRDSTSYAKMVAAWCANDRRAALTALKAGSVIVESKGCETPVPEHYKLGLKLGLPGTPSIVTDDGRLIKGFSTVEKLVDAVLD